MSLVNTRPIHVRVLPNSEAAQVLDDKGKVISTGARMDRIRIAAFPKMGTRFDFAGFIQKKSDPRHYRFWEKIIYDHQRFTAIVKGETVDVFVRTESVRKRLGIGEKELRERAKEAGMWRDFLGIWRHDVMYEIVNEYYCTIQGSQDLKQAKENDALLLQPRLEYIEERERNPLSERHQLSKEERGAIQRFASSQWSGWVAQLTQEPLISIEIDKKDSCLPHTLLVAAYPPKLGERPEIRLLVVLPRSHQIDSKTIYPVIDFYRPEERLFITHEQQDGIAAHETEMRGWIRRFPLVSQPIALLNAGYELYSVDRELARLQREYPVLTDSSQQVMGDLICHVEAMHREGVLLGAFNPVTYVEERGAEGPIARGALLGLEYATTPEQRTTNRDGKWINWGNSLYFAPEVAQAAHEMGSHPEKSFSPASDMWVLGLRLTNLLQSPHHEPCAVLNAALRVESRWKSPPPLDPHQEYLKRLEQIGKLGDEWMGAPKDRSSMEYLAYLMLKFNPDERITAREALRRYYGIVVHQKLVEITKGSVAAPEGWVAVSERLQWAMNHNLLGRDMRSDHLSQDELRKLMDEVSPFAEGGSGYAREFKEILICLEQLLLHPSERERA